MKRLKYKTFRAMAKVGVTLPLRYSIWSNMGVLVVVFSALNYVSDAPCISKDLSIITGMIGILMSMNIIIDVIKED